MSEREDQGGCAESGIDLVAFVRGELSPTEDRRVRAHVFACSACRDQLAMDTAVFDLAAMIPEVAVSADFDRRLEQRLDARFGVSRHASVGTRSSGRRASDSGRIAGLMLFVRHRVRTAPVLAASFLIHLGVAAFLSVFVYERVRGSHPGVLELTGLAGEDRGGGADTDPSDPMLRQLPDGLDGLPGTKDLAWRLPEPPDPPPPAYLPRPGLERFAEPWPQAPRELPSLLAYRRRGAEELARLGESASAPAIAGGLEWLAGAQAADGSWTAGAGTAYDATDYRVGVTGLALLAFLAEGESARYGVHRASVARGLTYLRAAQDADGLVGPRRGNYLYNHVIATHALAEHLLLGGCPAGQVESERDRIARAVRLLVRAQQDSGGWGYTTDPGTVADSSVTGWVAALARVLRAVECPLPAHSLQAMRVFWSRVTDADGQVGYRRLGESTDDRFTLSCAGLLAQRVLDAERGAVRGLARASSTLAAQRAAVLRTGLAALEEPVLDLALAHQTTLALAGLPEDAQWHPALRARLIATQAGGSWVPNDRYGALGGPVYATAAAVLSLQSHYRYR